LLGGKNLKIERKITKNNLYVRVCEMCFKT